MQDEETSAAERTKLGRKALSRWDGVAESLQFVTEGENIVYRFRDTQNRERYLRVCKPGYRPRDEVEVELEFVRHLHAKNVPVASPVLSLKGKWLETLRDPEGDQYAAVFEAVYGEAPVWGTDVEENKKMLRGRGKAMGRMHAAARSFKPSGKASRFHWYEDDIFTDPHQYFAKNDRAARREYQTLIEWMLSREATEENYGIVHGDFGSGNTLRQPDGSLVAYDFDDCLQHWYIYDMAVSIKSARAMPYEQRKMYLQAMLEGYAEEKNLGGDGAKEVEMCCRLAALYRYVTVLREYDRRHMTSKQRDEFNYRLEAITNPQRWH